MVIWKKCRITGPLCRSFSSWWAGFVWINTALSMLKSSQWHGRNNTVKMKRKCKVRDSYQRSHDRTITNLLWRSSLQNPNWLLDLVDCNCIGARPRRLDKLRWKGIIIPGYSEFPLQIKSKSEVEWSPQGARDAIRHMKLGVLRLPNYKSDSGGWVVRLLSQSGYSGCWVLGMSHSGSDSRRQVAEGTWIRILSSRIPNRAGDLGIWVESGAGWEPCGLRCAGPNWSHIGWPS